ncbi:hypothetical protein [Streptomyces katrae]|uniref:hypothetical protein n=1 Tax=Streptomyces katrae TaxID=68223 RepID=UPI002D21DF20|nr:hypothetical protein [Streptomyces katrae]
MAPEDACVLFSCLAACLTGGASPSRALRRYEELRRPRVEKRPSDVRIGVGPRNVPASSPERATYPHISISGKSAPDRAALPRQPWKEVSISHTRPSRAGKLFAVPPG